MKRVFVTVFLAACVLGLAWYPIHTPEIGLYGWRTEAVRDNVPGATPGLIVMFLSDCPVVTLCVVWGKPMLPRDHGVMIIEMRRKEYAVLYQNLGKFFADRDYRMWFMEEAGIAAFIPTNILGTLCGSAFLKEMDKSGKIKVAFDHFDWWAEFDVRGIWTLLNLYPGVCEYTDAYLRSMIKGGW